MSRKLDDSKEIYAQRPGIEKFTCARLREHIQFFQFCRGDLLRNTCDFEVTKP